MSCKCEICYGQHLTEDHDRATVRPTPPNQPSAEAMAAANEIGDDNDLSQWGRAAIIDRHFATLREENERLKLLMGPPTATQVQMLESARIAAGHAQAELDRLRSIARAAEGMREALIALGHDDYTHSFCGNPNCPTRQAMKALSAYTEAVKGTKP